jgi:hypothetical protein
MTVQEQHRRPRPAATAVQHHTVADIATPFIEPIEHAPNHSLSAIGTSAVPPVSRDG